VRRADRAQLTLSVLALLLAAFSLFWNVRNQREQERQGRVTEEKICTTLGKLAALKPPPGNPEANPSRGYDQSQHATLAQLAPDLGCRA
jgi:hypothetical protein